MCVNPTRQFYPVDELTQTRRSDYQVPLALYPFAARMSRGQTKCLGCKTCYLYHSDNGEGQPPLTGKELCKTLRSKVRPHHREFLTSPMDAFLHSRVALTIERVNNAFPLKFNLITKRPKVALHSLRKHASIWEEVDYHIQVVAIKDGLPNGESIVEDTQQLAETATSVSVRIDPFVPGLSSVEVFVELIEQFAEAGIDQVTTGMLALYKGQVEALAAEHGEAVDQDVLREHYRQEGESALRGIHIGEQKELNFVTSVQKTCDRVGVTSGVWSTRPQCRQVGTGEADGCKLPTAEEIRRRYIDAEARDHRGR